MAEVHKLEAWIGQQVSLYPREEGPEARTIGLLRTVDDRGVILEEPGGIISFYPWMVIFTIRVGEPEEQPTVKVGEPEEQPTVKVGEPEEQPRQQRRRRDMPISGGWGGWYPPG